MEGGDGVQLQQLLFQVSLCSEEDYKVPFFFQT